MWVSVGELDVECVETRRGLGFMDSVFVFKGGILLIFLLCAMHCVILLVFGGGSFASFSCEWRMMTKVVKECMYTFHSYSSYVTI